MNIDHTLQSTECVTAIHKRKLARDSNGGVWDWEGVFSLLWGKVRGPRKNFRFCPSKCCAFWALKKGDSIQQL